MGEFFRRLLYYLRRRQFEEELAEEMEHHAELSGRPRFGNVTLLKEESRAMWTWTFLEQLGQDLRYALRTMANNKAFTALAALSLALGIGANTAIYSFMDAILLRSLPVQNPESLVMLNWHGQGFGHETAGTGQVNMSVVQRVNGTIDSDPRGGVISGIFPYPAFELLRDSDSVFSSVFGYCRDFSPFNVKIHGQADMANIEYVSGDYFRGLGVPPAAGRLVLPDDDRTSSLAVAVVSFAYSQKRFGGSSQAVGSTILINDVPFTIAGVAPPEFFGVDPSVSPDLYLPMHTSVLIEPPGHPYGAAQQYLDPRFYGFQMMARLWPGVSLVQASATLAPMFHEWVSSTAANDDERAKLPELVLRPGGGGVDRLRRLFSKPLFLLLALVGLILAIACANIANLLLARATARRREMAIRLSMGASRLRVIRQLLTESVLLASLGGALGIVFAMWGIRVLTVLLANGREFTVRAELNWHVLGVTMALSLLTGVLFGLAPAIQSTRVDVIPALKQTTTGKRGHGAVPQALLLVGQIAISLLVLVTAGLFVRTLSSLRAVQLGFNRENLLLFQVNARLAGYRDPEITDFYRSLQTQFQAIPGVRNASLSSMSMMEGGRLAYTLHIRGKETPVIGLLAVGPSFLETMQIPVLLGHDIEDRGHAVAVVDEQFAKAYFGDESPVGQHINVPDKDMEIVGVSANARYGDLTDSPEPVIYYLYNRAAFPTVGQMIFELRTAGNPLAYVNTVREIVRKADPGVPVFDVKTQTAQIDERMNQQITFTRLSTAFATLALAITCVGLYGTVSYNVARRTKEIGIRMALGARPGAVVWMVLREIFILAAVGLTIGVPIALATSKFLESFLFGIKPNDSLAIAVAVAILIAATAVAGYAPARRASKIDPMDALRHE